MAVFYKCKLCGEEHQAPLGIGDKVTFNELKLEGTTIYCDRLFKSDSYKKDELYWKDEVWF